MAARENAFRATKAFIVNIQPSAMADLSPRACKLLLALLRKADGRTGELKLPKGWNRAEPYWFKGTEFEKWAHMSKPTRIAAINELKRAGFITTFRRSVQRVIEGRRRAVPGAVEYTLHRQPKPKNDQKAAKSSKVKVDSGLRKSTSLTVKELYPEVFQTTPSSVVGSVSVLPCSNNSSPVEGNHHQHPENRDDDSPTVATKDSNPNPKGPEKPNPPVEVKTRPAPETYEERLGKLAETAKKIILAEMDPETRAWILEQYPNPGDAPELDCLENFVDEQFAVVIEQHLSDLANGHSRPVCTPRFFEVAFANESAAWKLWVEENHPAPAKGDPWDRLPVVEAPAPAPEVIARPEVAESDVEQDAVEEESAPEVVRVECRPGQFHVGKKVAHSDGTAGVVQFVGEGYALIQVDE